MEIIVPAAGLSTRFPNMKPKYLLVDYKKRMMLELAVKPYIGRYPITVGILRQHEEEYNATKQIRSYLGDAVNIVILDSLTNGPAETVYNIIKQSGIDGSSPILVKDCDSFFSHDEDDDNYVCVSKISLHEVLKKLASKSFVVSNDQNIIQRIVEKTVISDTFCVGAYKFRSAELFCESFEHLSSTNQEIFVSHVIEYCLSQHEVFTEKVVRDYVDVGTFSDWSAYNDKPVFFCDIDGTIVKAQGHNDNSDPVVLSDNVSVLLTYQSIGSQFIFVTARLSQNYEQTYKMLTDIGFKDFQLIMGLQNSRRVLINDYNSANPFPRAEAINILRDSDNLRDYLR